MRYSYFVFIGMIVAALMLLSVYAPSGPAVRSEEDLPGLIILFSGDLDGYLEECG